jgi:hypothetical protein
MILFSIKGAFDLKFKTFILHNINSGLGVFKALRTITRLLVVSCEHNIEHTGYIKSREFLSLAEKMLASEELFCLMEMARTTIAKD